MESKEKTDNIIKEFLGIADKDHIDIEDIGDHLALAILGRPEMYFGNGNLIDCFNAFLVGFEIGRKNSDSISNLLLGFNSYMHKYNKGCMHWSDYIRKKYEDEVEMRTFLIKQYIEYIETNA